MAPKTIKGALGIMLEDLSEQNFEKFCSQLLDRREEPRVRRRQVEGKNFLDIANVLVSVFTEDRAHVVAVELLKGITCVEEAVELEKVIAGLSSPPRPSDATQPSAGATGGTMAEDKHFVDKHKLELIDRVSNTAPILDELLEQGVITHEKYADIRALPTCQGKMRELYSGCLRAGKESKDVFYQILKKHEAYLIRDLENNS
ncbi:apoptosis-associated speck-like protein containing a CARD [Notolabrus celidotus]|uniref:apoptosis-associated speck-like protein containing a CARD n=1 Tax=Notolabrus celidotus TaxID=1203425 RepID=UPI00148FC3C4|nr:apoptosis-associated speck-like protein containing a CARD [Notolabrus celidotus]